MPKGNQRGFFTKPLTRKKAKKQAKLAGRLAVRPERRQIQAEKRATDVSRQRINDYFPAYGQAVDQAATRTASAYTQAGQGIANTAQTGANYAETLRQRLGEEARADAQRRGAVYDPSSDQTGVAANLARMNSAQTLQGVVGAQGASQSAYLADKKRIGERERIEQLLRAEQRGRSYDQDLRALGKQEGDIRRQTLSELRDSERDYSLAKKGMKTTRRGQNITAANAQRSAAVSAANSRRSSRTTRRGQDLTAQNSRRSARTSRQNSIRSAAGSEGGSKPEKGDVRQASAYLRQAKKGSYSNPKSAVDYLINRGVDPKAARKAVKKASGGKKGGGRSSGPKRFGGSRTN